MDVKVSIIIVNYHGKHHLKDCLDSIAAQTYGNVQTIMVDNASNDGSCEFVKANYPWVELIVNKKNLGFCGGNSIGAGHAAGEMILFLNNDTKIDVNCIEEMVAEIQSKNDNCIGIFPKALYFNEPHIINSYGVVWNYKNHWRDNKMGLIDNGGFDFPHKIFGSIFAAVMFKKELFLKIGGFDDDFFTYGEDFDLSYRANLAGYSFYTAPKAIVYHKFRASSKEDKTPEWSYYYFVRNYLLVFFKNYERRSLILYLPVILRRYYLPSLKWSVLNRKIRRTFLHFKVLVYFFFNFFKILKKRRFIEKIRKKADYEIWNWSPEIGRYNVFHYENVTVLGLKNLRTSMRKMKEDGEYELMKGIVPEDYLKTVEENAAVPVSTVNQITGGVKIGQFFTAPDNYLSSICLKFATYDRVNTKDICFSLREMSEGGKIIRRIIVNASHLKDNQFYSFHFPPVKKSKKRLYHISVSSPDSNSDDCVTLICAQRFFNFDKNQVELYKKGNERNNGLLFRHSYANRLYKFLDRRLEKSSTAAYSDGRGALTSPEAKGRGTDEKKESKMKKILVLCGDTVNKKMAGPAIRCVEFATVLSGKFNVTLGIPNETDASFDAFSVKKYDYANAQSILNLIQENDVILISSFDITPFSFFDELDKPVIFDIYVPLTLESLEFHKDEDDLKRRKMLRCATATLIGQLKIGDFFICASEKQRSYWLGMLSLLGRIDTKTYNDDNSLRNLIDVVPFGISSTPPEHKENVLKGKLKNIKADDFLFIWAGGIWNWFDPLTPIKAVAKIAKERDDVKLFFMGTTHPSGQIPKMKMCTDAIELAKELGVYDKHVFFNEGWIPYSKRANYLKEADCGITAHFNHVETEFSFRTRVLDYFWATLPVITTKGDSLSGTIERGGGGIVMDYEDVNGWTEAMLKLVSDKEAFEVYKSGIKKIAVDFRWEDISAPVVKFCENPVKRKTGDVLEEDAEDRIDDLGEAIVQKLKRRKSELSNQIYSIEHKFNLLSNKMKEIDLAVSDHSSFIHKIRNTFFFRFLRKLRGRA